MRFFTTTFALVAAALLSVGPSLSVPISSSEIPQRNGVLADELVTRRLNSSHSAPPTQMNTTIKREPYFSYARENENVARSLNGTTSNSRPGRNNTRTGSFKREMPPLLSARRLSSTGSSAHMNNSRRSTAPGRVVYHLDSRENENVARRLNSTGSTHSPSHMNNSRRATASRRREVYRLDARENETVEARRLNSTRSNTSPPSSHPRMNTTRTNTFRREPRPVDVDANPDADHRVKRSAEVEIRDLLECILARSE